MTHIVVGITGNIASGKSTISKVFESKGYCVQNADTVVHDIYTHDTQAIEHIAKDFPTALLDGKISRDILKIILQKNPERRVDLERIVHPFVARKRTDFIRQNTRVVLDVPLLFEAGINRVCHVVIVAYCEDDIRKKRVLERGMTADMFTVLNTAQWNQAEKCKRADIVIHTNKSLASTHKDVLNAIATIEEDFFYA